MSVALSLAGLTAPAVVASPSGQAHPFLKIDKSIRGVKNLESISVKGSPLTSLIFDDVHWHVHIDLVAHHVYFITPMVL